MSDIKAHPWVDIKPSIQDVMIEFDVQCLKGKVVDTEEMDQGIDYLEHSIEQATKGNNFKGKVSLVSFNTGITQPTVVIGFGGVPIKADTTLVAQLVERSFNYLADNPIPGYT